MVRPPFTGATNSRNRVTANCSLNLPAPGGGVTYTSSYGCLSCVFDKQLAESIHAAADFKPAPPEVTSGSFAEFHNESSLAHLRAAASTTCVGLRYG